MRVADKTIYDMIRINLGRIGEDLYKANKVMTTGKRINSLSDDPIGLAQCLNIKSLLSNIEQLKRNIATGRTWLESGETSLRNMNDLIADAKVLCVQMVNSTVSHSDRAYASTFVDGILRQVLTLANTEVDGKHIFAGTETDTRPFAFDDEENPTNVTYSGNHSRFSVKIGKHATIAVGRDGEDVFTDSYVTIGESNNSIDFIEYLGGSPSNELTAGIPGGIYGHGQLAAAVEGAMEQASSESGNAIDYEVTYDSSTKKFTIQDNGANPGFELDLLWRTGSHVDDSIGSELGFDDIDVKDRLIASDNVVMSVTITAGVNDTIEFREDVGAGPGAVLSINIPAGVYNTDPLLAGLAGNIEGAMDAESAANGNGVDYKVTYDAANDRFIMEEEGPGLQLKELRLLWNSGLGTTQAAATALGFNNTADDVYAPPTGGSKVEWGIFKTLMDLKYYLEADDVGGISRSMTRLDFHFDNLSAVVSDTGAREVQLDIKEKIISDMNLSHLERKSRLEDADMVEAITEMHSRESAYKAALSASARAMQLSVVDYL
ncbi:MAG: flagellar hook-associated protein FlgL [Desulfobacterales bacterium]|nr:flagellar hook-associated protein FlgL [Desulfobacterales bacterium]